MLVFASHFGLQQSRDFSTGSVTVSGDDFLVEVGPGQYHLAVAGGCAAFWRRDEPVAGRLRTHPLPRGGTDPVQVRLMTLMGLHKKSKESAEGAQCESQGQARAKRSASPLGYDKALGVKA